jgi:hypothetical protein
VDGRDVVWEEGSEAELRKVLSKVIGKPGVFFVVDNNDHIIYH